MKNVLRHTTLDLARGTYSTVNRNRSHAPDWIGYRLRLCSCEGGSRIGMDLHQSRLVDHTRLFGTWGAHEARVANHVGQKQLAIGIWWAAASEAQTLFVANQRTSCSLETLQQDMEVSVVGDTSAQQHERRMFYEFLLGPASTHCEHTL